MAKSNDSLLKIASLTEDELNQYYQNYIDKIKEKERVARIKELKKLAAQNQLANNQASGGWYFFNRNAKDQGRVEFQEKWGNIKRRPNWYISSGVNNAQETIENPLEGVVVTSSEYTKYDVAYYTTRINRSPRFLAETTKNRNLNYYELGNVYYSQLNEKDLAINKLEQLIDFKPAKELKMGAYYRLYRIYQDAEDNEGMAVYKSKLENEFPNSSFTKMINNITSTENELEAEDEYVKCYETIYELYQLKSYQAALEEVENARAKYANTNLAPKYDLLHAYIVAKVKGKKDFYKLLNDIKLSYPGTEQAKKADEFLNNN